MCISFPSKQGATRQPRSAAGCTLVEIAAPLTPGPRSQRRTPELYINALQRRAPK